LQTKHRIFFTDASQMISLENESVDLVVTSPPYPMIKMWDDLFAAANPEIGASLAAGEGEAAFEKMHLQLDSIWLELWRVMKNGSYACINIGDAVRTLDGKFKLYPNQVRIAAYFFKLGFDRLPSIIWRKSTTAPNKFMGSGMLPAGAYVTLEHEYILIFRKGSKRVFKSEEQIANRRRSALFWAERNCWYSDLWELSGARQKSTDNSVRNRSAAFPFAVPFRLINMFSVYGDTVLDPFLGTGTTILAAAAAARNSIGFENDIRLRTFIDQRLNQENEGLSEHNRKRLEGHKAFVEESAARGKSFKYQNKHYGFPVMTAQECELLLYGLQKLQSNNDQGYRGEHQVIL
jgi:modification methylase